MSRPSLAERRQLRRGELLDAAIDVIRRRGRRRDDGGDGDRRRDQQADPVPPLRRPRRPRRGGHRDGAAWRSGRSSTTSSARRGPTRRRTRSGRRSTPSSSTSSGSRSCIASSSTATPRRGKPATVAFTEQIAERVAETLAHGLVDHGRDPAPAAIWGRAIVGMVQNTAAWWTGGADISRREAVDALTDLAWVGMVGVTDRRRHVKPDPLDELRATVPRPPRGDGAAQPRRADVVRRRSQGVRDVRRPSPRRPPRLLVRGAARLPARARRRRPAALLRPALRRRTRLDRAFASTSATSTGTRSASSSRTPTGWSPRSDSIAELDARRAG